MTYVLENGAVVTDEPHRNGAGVILAWEVVPLRLADVEAWLGVASAFREFAAMVLLGTGFGEGRSAGSG